MAKSEEDKGDNVLVDYTVIRRIRYSDAKIVNLSTENKDVTFEATNPTAHNEDERVKVKRWANYNEKDIEATLIRAVDENITVSLLVHRRRLTYENKKDKSKSYDFFDYIVSAILVW